MKSRSSTSSRSISYSGRLALLDEDQPRRRRAARADGRARSRSSRRRRVDQHGAVANVRGDLARSTSTCSRPSTSSTCTGRIWPARFTSPAISSCRPGSVFTGHAFGPRQLDDLPPHLARRGRHRDQHLVGPVVAQDVRSARRSCRARVRRGCGGSSCAGRRRRARSACRRAARLRCISRISIDAASPAPTTSTSRPRATSPPCGRSISERASRRDPATNASSSR